MQCTITYVGAKTRNSLNSPNILARQNLLIYSMLTYIYPHKPLRRTEVTICNHQADSHFMCGLMSDLVICKFRKNMIIHDSECPYRDQVSLKNTNQTSDISSQSLSPNFVTLHHTVTHNLNKYLVFFKQCALDRLYFSVCGHTMLWIHFDISSHLQ